MEPSLEAKLNEKIDKQTENFKRKLKRSRIFLSRAPGSLVCA